MVAGEDRGPDRWAQSGLTHHPRVIQAWIDAADPGTTVRLPPGEYRGPLVIDKSLRLVGQGRLTPIWCPQGPPVVVLAAGVVIEDVLVEQTVAAFGPLIVHREGCQPELRNVDPPKVGSLSMNSEQLIDLGDLAAGKDIALPFEFAHGAGWVANRERLPFGAQTGPLPKLEHDPDGFVLRLSMPDDDGYLYDFLSLDQPSTSQSERYMVRGTVHRQMPGPGGRDLALQMTDGPTLYFERFLEITARQLAALGQRRWSYDQGTRYLMILTEADARRVLWLPAKLPDGLKIAFEGEPLRAWTRRVLAPRQSIALDGISFEVVERRRAPIKMPGEIDFGAVEVLSAEPLPVKITRGGRRPWEGRVQSLVPWLKPDQDAIEIKGRGTSLSLTLDTAAMPNGLYSQPSALLVHNDEDAFFVDVKCRVNIPDHAFRIVSDGLQPLVDPDNPFIMGELSGRKAFLEVKNVGRQDVTLRVDGHAGWFDLDLALDETGLMVPAGEDLPVRITVTLNEKANALPDGPLEEGMALVLSCPEIEEEKQRPIPFRAIIAAPRAPEIVIVPPADRQVTVNLYRPEPVRLDVLLKNEGAVTGRFELDGAGLPDGASLTPDGGTGTLDPGHEVRCAVILPADAFEGAAAGETRAYPVTVLGDDGENLVPVGTVTLAVTFENRYPVLEFRPGSVRLDEVVAGQTTVFEQGVTLANTGTDTFLGRVAATVDWLTLADLPPEALRLKPGDETPFKLRANDRLAVLPAGQYTVDTALEARPEANQPDLPSPAALVVRVDVAPAEPLILLHNEFLWFGSPERFLPLDSLPKDEIVIGNYGFADWEANLMHLADWLDLEASHIVIPRQQVLRLRATLNRQVDDLPAGPTTEPRAVVFQDDTGQEFVIAARILLRDPAPVLVATPAELAFDPVTEGHAVGQKLTLVLSNDGTAPWEFAGVSAPDWLWVDREAIPSQLRPGGRSGPIPAELAADFVTRQPHVYQDRLVIQGADGHHASIPVTFEVAPAEIRLEPEPPDYLVVPLYQSDPLHRRTTQPDARRRLVITNEGRAPFVLVSELDAPDRNFRSSPFIEFKPPLADREVIQPGESKVIVVRLADEDSLVVRASKPRPDIKLTLPDGSDRHVLVEYRSRSTS